MGFKRSFNKAKTEAKRKEILKGFYKEFLKNHDFKHETLLMLSELIGKENTMKLALECSGSFFYVPKTGIEQTIKNYNKRTQENPPL